MIVIIDGAVFIKSLQNDDYFFYCATRIANKYINNFKISEDLEDDARQEALIKADLCRKHFDSDNETICMGFVKTAIIRALCTFVTEKMRNYVTPLAGAYVDAVKHEGATDSYNIGDEFNRIAKDIDGDAPAAAMNQIRSDVKNHKLRASQSVPRFAMFCGEVSASYQY